MGHLQWICVSRACRCRRCLIMAMFLRSLAASHVPMPARPVAPSFYSEFFSFLLSVGGNILNKRHKPNAARLSRFVCPATHSHRFPCRWDCSNHLPLHWLFDLLYVMLLRSVCTLGPAPQRHDQHLCSKSRGGIFQRFRKGSVRRNEGVKCREC